MSSPPATRDAASSDPLSRQVSTGQDGEAVSVPSVSHDDTDRLARQLHLRRTRFKASQLSADVTPTATRWSTIDCSASPDSERSSSMDSQYDSSPERRSTQHDGGILRDISNSSLRRRAARLGEEQRKETSRIGSLVSQFEKDKPASPTSPKTERARLARTMPSRRHASTGETSKYIEHLESQLVSLQTQLSTLTSPSTSKTQSAKLRAMNTETKMLRQELTEWETKFHERLREQVNEHKLTVDGLQHQLKTMETDLEQTNTRVHELEVDVKDKVSLIAAAESANYDLERRLEFMSELLATSPTRIELHPDAPDQAQRRPPRPKSMGPPRLPSLSVLFSPKRQVNSSMRASITSPETPSPYVGSRSFDGFPFESAAALEKRTSRAESNSDLSETTLVNIAESPNARDTPLLQQMYSDKDAKSKPIRRMRRFYAGSMGPRSLILPATTNASSTASPVAGSNTPKAASVVGTPADALGISSAASDMSSDTPGVPRRRSASWYDHIGTNHARQRSSLSSLNTRGDRTSFYSNMSGSNRNSVIITEQDQPVLLPPFENQDVGNLYDELSRVKQDYSSDEAGSVTSPRCPVPSVSEEKLALSASEATLPRNDSPCQGPSPEDIQSSSAEVAGIEPAEPHIACETVVARSNKPRARSTGQPATLAAHMLAHCDDTPDTSQSARNVFSNAWARTVFSRPMLALRWWLVRLLLGDIKRKGYICSGECIRKSRSSSPDMRADLELSVASKPIREEPASASDEGENDSVGRHGKRGIVDAASVSPGSRRRSHAKFPSPHASVGLSPVTAWLKFSMTILFAVGLAIRDGPQTLYEPPNG